MVDKTALQEQVRQVARAREEAQRLADEKAAKLKAWEEENQLFLDTVKEAAKYRDEQENQLRELTLLVYQETGEKKPCEGVGVREGEEYQYEPEKAYAWAINHKLALKLDDRAFKDMCKTASTRPEFVEVLPKITATIATDLSKVLKMEVK